MVGSRGAHSTMPIEFRDEAGLRWTVEHRVAPAAAGPRQAVIDLVCETGEHRKCEVLALENDAWEHVSEGAWRTLLRRARVVRRRRT